MGGKSAQKGFIYQRVALISFALIKDYFKEIGYENDEDITIEYDNSIDFIQAKAHTKNFSNSLVKDVITNWINFHNLTKYANKEKKYILILSGKSSINKDELKEEYTDKISLDIIEQFEIMENQSFNVLRQKCIESLKEFQKYKKVNIDDKILEEQYNTLYSDISLKIDKSMEKTKPYTINIKDWQYIVDNIVYQINGETYNINTSDRIEEIKSSDEIINKFKKTNRAYQQLLSVFPHDKQYQLMNYLACNILYNEFRDKYNEIYQTSIDNWEGEAVWNYNQTVDDISINNNNQLFHETLKKILNIEFIKSSKIYSDGCYIYLTEDFIDKDKQITWNKYEK
ncbi:MAG: hypothetical protein SPF17_07460 [Candidatus Mucispirillum faecigallinarum]|nr:hypothetical protein [Candidatus Mucispirillum faecigallinarum]